MIKLQEPKYVYMGGGLRPWHEATLHVGCEAAIRCLNVFEGLKGYWQPEGPFGVLQVRSHYERLCRSARLRIMGRLSDGPARISGRDIESLGWVDDAAEEIATWSAMVVPVRSGAGTRGKIAQAYSLKCPVVSTSIGAYGYGAADGREMFLADAPEDFAAACVKTIRQPAEAVEMAERAWRQFLEKWTWDAIAPRVVAAAEDCLRLSGGHAAAEERTASVG